MNRLPLLLARDGPLPIVPTDALLLLAELAPVFTRPTFPRFFTLRGAALRTTGRRTIAHWLRTAGTLAPGHRTSYQRVRAPARWSSRQRAGALTRVRVHYLLPTGLILRGGDDTGDGPKGKQV